jgi:predicted nucleotidyltransferase
VNAEPQLARVARALKDCGLEAILIGNAAAALRGAPVTTLDFDFLIREAPGHVEKLKALAARLGAVLLDPASPTTTLRRLENEQDDLYLDFVSQAHGITSFASLRSRAATVEFSGCPILVAALEDVLASKRAANRPQDQAVLPVLEKTIEEQRRRERRD